LPAKLFMHFELVDTMRIFINGDPRDVPDTTRMTDLIQLLELGGKRVAVEVNEELVPRSTFDTHGLSPDDQIEIIHAVGGG
jgi:thiamine biosynthesis protein ThiS